MEMIALFAEMLELLHKKVAASWIEPKLQFAILVRADRDTRLHEPSDSMLVDRNG
jgi:hypothetical protein